jgi:hypothetical protein
MKLWKPTLRLRLIPYWECSTCGSRHYHPHIDLANAECDCGIGKGFWFAVANPERRMPMYKGRDFMKHALVLVVLVGTMFGQTPLGKWQDTTKDSGGFIFLYNGSDKDSAHLLVSEDYEVLATHEICASVYGYFMEKSAVGRYNVNFRGLRTSATFTFTTRYDAEHWVMKFCTPQSLTGIKAGGGNLGRSY